MELDTRVFLVAAQHAYTGRGIRFIRQHAEVVAGAVAEERHLSNITSGKAMLSGKRPLKMYRLSAGD